MTYAQINANLLENDQGVVKRVQQEVIHQMS